MSSTPLHLVKWSFPAFALILGLLWYKRRRVDRVDPGGITKNPEAKVAAQEIGPRATDATSRANMNLYDSGIHIDESFTSNSSCQKTMVESTSSPRKVSESLDIPRRKSSPQQIPSLQPETYFNDAAEWYKEVDGIPDPVNVQLGSNPQISNFEMIVRSRAGSSVEAANCQDNKVLKIFENSSVESEQRQQREQSLECNENVDTVSECVCVENKTEETQECLDDSVKAQVQVLSERDSANHSPVSGVLEGSVTDEARSEGSTDSGKGGSINGHTKDVHMPTVYEFSVPQMLVGRLIGRHGSFLQYIRNKALVNIAIKRYPASRDQKICSIEGSTEGINLALDLIRQKFPEKKYPEITLEQVSSLVKIPEEVPWVPELTQLSLIEGVNNDVIVSHIIKPNRLFVQLPTHPTYPSLRLLDANMTLLYNTVESPPVPDQLSKGNVVVAKWYDKWVRVSIENPDPHGERHLVRLVDHGGYWVFSNAELRKIRSDYLALPFQAIEVFLANIQPKNGEWQEEAYSVVAHMCSGIVGQAQIEGYINTNTYINLYLNIQKHGVISLADELIARGYAEPVPLEAIVPEDVPVF